MTRVSIAVASLLLSILAGCDSKPASESLEMHLPKIERLCALVAQRDLAMAPKEVLAGQLNYDRIYEGAKAACELEYRVRQQEASEPF